MNHLRVPKQVCFESEVEAYHTYTECGAACRHFDIATLKSVDPTQQWLHSVCHESNYSNPYAAVLRAIEARFQVCFPELDSMKTQSHNVEPYLPTQLRTTDELHDATVIRSVGQEENAIEHITDVDPVDPLLIIEDWEELRIILRDQSTNPSEEMVIVMYGLYQAHVGERRASSQKDIHAVRECVFRTWDDFLLPGVTAFLHLVRPQEHLQLNEIHAIVEFSSLMVPLPNIGMPSLRRTIWHSVGADHPIVVAAYHTPGTNRFELLRGTGLFDWCGPDSRATCNIFIEKALLPPLALARIQQGSLLEVFVHDVFDTDATSTLQVGSAFHHGESNPRTTDPQDVPLDSLSTHVIDRWCDSWSSCDVQEVIPKAKITQARPNGDIGPDHDGQVPYQYRLHNGARISGTIIPPPNWNRLSGLRYADDRGAVVRDAAHQLRVHIRSWLLPHDRFGPLYWKDCTIPAQLFIRLLDRLTSVWQPELLQGDRLRMRIVQPTPAPPVGDQARLHILLECNRPHVSTRRAILLSFQELNQDGPSPDKIWIPYLSPQVITPQIIAGILPLQCDSRHLIVPAGTPDRRWLAEHEERAVDDGLYLPTLRNIRRGVPTQRMEIDEATLMQTGLLANDGDDLTLLQRDADDTTDSLQLMQRSGSRTPRRDHVTPSSMGSSLSTVLAHVFHLSAEHRLITFDREAPLSFFQQLDSLWKRPVHAHSIALHEVKMPPPDLEASADVVFVYEQAPDRTRQAAATDQLILLDVEVYSHGEASPGKHLRRVLWSRKLMNRQAMLSLAASFSLCEVPGTTCELSINRHIWPEEDTANRHVLHGDFIRLRIEAASPSGELHMALCDQEFADAQRYVFGRSPSRSPTPSDSVPPDEEQGPFDEAASSSLLQIHAATISNRPIRYSDDSTVDDDGLRVNARLKETIEPHVGDLWCASSLPSDPLGLPVRNTSRASVPGSADTDAYIYVDFAPAFHSLDWIDTHFFLPVYDLDREWPWQKVSEHWLDLPWWTPGDSAQSIWIYFDGSSAQQRELAGCGIACFILDGTWKFAGALSAKLPEETTSYGAEAAGAAIATKLIFDILKVTSFITPPEVWLCYDSTTVGEQAVGNWEARRAPNLFTFMRSMSLLIEHRFHVRIQHHHIYGHTGEPGNEIVDVLAGQAGRGHALIDADHFLAWIQRADFTDGFSWSWFPFRSDVELNWDHMRLVLPAKPTSVPPASVLPVSAPTRTSVRSQVQLGLATLNVLTLKGADSVQHGLQGVARQSAILQQLFDIGIHIFALQETRLRRTGGLVSDHYLLLASQASPQGHFGMMVGFDFKRPHGTITDEDGQTSEIKFQRSHLSIIHSDSRSLIVKVHTPALKCIVVAGHAPHTGISDEAGIAWWQSLIDRIPMQFATWDRLALVDANCRVGSFPSDSVGTWQAEEDGKHSEAFHNFLLHEQLWLPATYHCCQSGPPGTWRHPNGNWYRGDYVALPKGWNYVHCQALVSNQIDASLLKEDHCAAVAYIETFYETFTSRAAPKPTNLDETTILHAMNRSPWIAQQLRAIKQQPWERDVHTHVAAIAEDVQAVIREAYVPPPPKPRKSTITATTWDMVLNKRQARNDLYLLRRQQQRSLLHTCFIGWRNGPLDVPTRRQCSRILADQDQRLAIALNRFRILGRAVCRALRADDLDFYSRLSSEAADFLGPHQAKKFWSVIRRALPQHRQRRSQPAPLSLQHLDDQWLPHFNQLECGTSTTADQLVQGCHAFQIEHLPAAGSVLELIDFPTLPDLERSFRATQAHKSVGLDSTPAGVFCTAAPVMARIYFDIMFKAFLWGSEPVQYKGGPMAVLPKKHDWSLARNFRGIMLLPTVSKRIHALLRERIIPLLAPIRPAGQIGGFRHQQTPFGSQAIRTLAKTLASTGNSVAILFIDLSEAFHRLVRELVTGVSDPQAIQVILESVNDSGISPAGLQRWLQVPGLLRRLGCSPVLERLLQDIHQHTWFCLQSHDGLSRTRRGTRPGSPLADIIFHVLMADCPIELNDWIQSDPLYSSILSDLGISFDSICWADDLAIPWATKQAIDLAPAMQRLLRFVKQTFERKGMALNMARGKTSIVAHFTGPGASTERLRLQTLQYGGEWLRSGRDDTDTDTWVHYVPTYKHLGTIVSSDLTLDHEVRTRIGISRAAFQQIKKMVLCNKRLPFQVRARLFKALILSKLYYGAGAWSPLPQSTLKRLRSALVSMARQILGVGSQDDTHLTTNTTLLRLQVLDPLAHIGVERLRYAASLFQHGWQDLHQLLEAEHHHGTQSWLAGLHDAIRWFNEVAMPQDEIPTDIEALKDYWRSEGLRWKRVLMKVTRRHMFQEHTIEQVKQYHRTFYKTLRSAGADFWPDPFALTGSDLTYSCACGRTFSTGQGLATHKRKAHGIFSPEHQFLQGATCPQCLKFFWSTQRLQQHLRYIPRRIGYNPCFAALLAVGYTTDYEAVPRPRHVKGLQRIETQPTYGPHGRQATLHDLEISKWEGELAELEAEDEIMVVPRTQGTTTTALHGQWTQVTLKWFADFTLQNFDAALSKHLPDLWVDVFVIQEDDIEDWLQDAFLEWGNTVLPEVLAAWEDGEAELLVETEYYKFIIDLPRHQRQTRISELRRLLAQPAEPWEPSRQPHRAPQPVGLPGPSTKPTFPVIERAYGQQKAWHDHLRSINWSCTIDPKPVPIWKEVRAKMEIVVAHLFSGPATYC